MPKTRLTSRSELRGFVEGRYSLPTQPTAEGEARLGDRLRRHRHEEDRAPTITVPAPVFSSAASPPPRMRADAQPSASRARPSRRAVGRLDDPRPAFRSRNVLAGRLAEATLPWLLPRPEGPSEAARPLRPEGPTAPTSFADRARSVREPSSAFGPNRGSIGASGPGRPRRAGVGGGADASDGEGHLQTRSNAADTRRMRAPKGRPPLASRPWLAKMPAMKPNASLSHAIRRRCGRRSSVG